MSKIKSIKKPVVWELDLNKKSQRIVNGAVKLLAPVMPGKSRQAIGDQFLNKAILFGSKVEQAKLKRRQPKAKMVFIAECHIENEDWKNNRHLWFHEGKFYLSASRDSTPKRISKIQAVKTYLRFDLDGECTNSSDKGIKLLLNSL